MQTIHPKQKWDLTVYGLEQLLGCASKILCDVRKMIIFFAGELRRWKGEHMLYSSYFERTGQIKGLPEGTDPSCTDILSATPTGGLQHDP